MCTLWWVICADSGVIEMEKKKPQTTYNIDAGIYSYQARKVASQFHTRQAIQFNLCIRPKITTKDYIGVSFLCADCAVNWTRKQNIFFYNFCQKVGPVAQSV
jgi:hypothetical protein